MRWANECDNRVQRNWKYVLRNCSLTVAAHGPWPRTQLVQVPHFQLPPSSYPLSAQCSVLFCCHTVMCCWSGHLFQFFVWQMCLDKKVESGKSYGAVPLPLPIPLGRWNWELERSCARHLALLYISLSQFLVKFGQMATWPIADGPVAGQRANLSACTARDSGRRGKKGQLGRWQMRPVRDTTNGSSWILIPHHAFLYKWALIAGYACCTCLFVWLAAKIPRIA